MRSCVEKGTSWAGPRQKHDFCLTNLHDRFELKGYQLQRQVQKLIVSLEEILNPNNSLIYLKNLFSVYTS